VLARASSDRISHVIGMCVVVAGFSFVCSVLGTSEGTDASVLVPFYTTYRSTTPYTRRSSVDGRGSVEYVTLYRAQSEGTTSFTNSISMPNTAMWRTRRLLTAVCSASRARRPQSCGTSSVRCCTPAAPPVDLLRALA